MRRRTLPDGKTAVLDIGAILKAKDEDLAFGLVDDPILRNAGSSGLTTSTANSADSVNCWPALANCCDER